MFAIPIYLTGLILVLLFFGFFFAETIKRFLPDLEGWEVPIAFGVAVVFMTLRYVKYSYHKQVAFSFIGGIILVTVVLKVIDIRRNRNIDDDDDDDF